MDKQVASKIHDEAREKIKDMVHFGGFQMENRKKSIGELILALSGTTDIMCPECKGGQNWATKTLANRSIIVECSKCNSTGVIKHKWKIAVVLENGELPAPDITTEAFPTPCNESCHLQEQYNMRNEGWVKGV